VPVSGTLATSEALDTASVTGETRIVGVLGVVDLPDTAAFTGTVAFGVNGVLDATEALDVASFAGVLGPVVIGPVIGIYVPCDKVAIGVHADPDIVVPCDRSNIKVR
jgi:hypothetical protein